MKDALPQTVYLHDYKVSPFLVDTTDLVFDLGDEQTIVTNTMAVRRNSDSDDQTGAFELNSKGEIELLWVEVDGQRLQQSAYTLTNNLLQLHNLPLQSQVKTQVAIKPQANTSMMGLYRSRTMYCTQCEAEGFRRITYYPDRPDIMSVFTVQIIADKTAYPVLLSNGNAIARGDLDNGRHFVTWHDPFKKPSHLFALVAGTLEVVEDSFTTMSGRQIPLQIFVEEKDLDKCDHAMLSLKNAMRWDEQVYGREYDLDIFMIVAVDDFNMGAMENKGLNIFNTSAVLANPKTTTDAAFQRVEGIVAHEYFHNWSGNRVNLRDWFQLSLKEGFTVYRDAQFSADMNSATVKRIEDVNYLRTYQFTEDGGPMAHPVQPDAYMEINNFYTLTVYEKGAEIIGMYHTLLGQELYRQATDLYFDRHDGQAVTIEEFVKAMEDVSGRDLTQFRRWYKQAGTPTLSVHAEYDSRAKTYRLQFIQNCPATPGQKDKLPFVIPVKLGLLGKQGELPVNAAGDNETVVELTQAKQQVVFENIDEEPIPSLLRGFSAPVKLDYNYSPDQLAFLMAHDTDGFNRWDACQTLSFMVLQQLTDDAIAQRPMTMDSQLIEAFKILIEDQQLDPAMVQLMLQLPSEAQLHERATEIQAQAIYQARHFARQAIAQALQEQLLAVYNRYNIQQTYAPVAEQIGRRALKNATLSYLMLIDNIGPELAWQQFQLADNMTDQAAALSALVNCPAAVEYAAEALQLFERQYQDEALVMNLWFQIQATNSQSNGLPRVQSLMQHSAFNMTNPNKIRSLIGAFCSANLVNFHNTDGSGYEFLQQQICALNSVNPQVAARLVAPLTRWKKFAQPNRQLMRDALEAIAQQPNLVKDIQEIISKSL
ncbi:MAG: aminopeptidase N [Porticoccaceae bacterium]|nr:aminopeptidase N [Porticoccaceae bacterium]